MNLSAHQRERVVLIYSHMSELAALERLRTHCKPPIYLLKADALLDIGAREPELVVLPCLVSPNLGHDDYLLFQHTLDMLLKTTSLTLETTLPMVAYDGVNDVLHPPLHWPHDAHVNSMTLRQYVSDYHVCDTPPQVLLGRYLAGEFHDPLPPDMLKIANLHCLREAMFSLVTIHAGDVARQLSLHGKTYAPPPLSLWAYCPSPVGFAVVMLVLALGILASRSALLPMPPWFFLALLATTLAALGATHIRTIWHANRQAQENYSHALLRMVYDVSYLNDADDIILTAMSTLRRCLGIHVVYGRVDNTHVSLMDETPLGDADYSRMLASLRDGHVMAPHAPETHGYIWCPVQVGQTTLGILGVKHTNGHRLDQTYALTEFLRTFTRLLASAVWRVRLDKEKTDAAYLASRESLRLSLLSSVSHDLQTPLAGVIGSLSTLLIMKDKLPNKARQNLLSAAYAEARRLQRIVQNVLAMAGMEMGNMVVRNVAMDIVDVVKHTAARVKHAYPKLAIQVEHDLGHLAVLGDELLLSQVFYNLLENAAKYGPPKHKICVNIHENIEKNMVQIDVTDRGPGIAPTDLPKVFDKYYRSLFTDRKHAGSGLGLAICRAIIEAHGGTIHATNRTDGKHGMVFTVLLPGTPLMPPTHEHTHKNIFFMKKEAAHEHT